MDDKLFSDMLRACWLIGAYFLAVSSHKRGRLNTSVYGRLGVGAGGAGEEWTFFSLSLQSEAGGGGGGGGGGDGILQ